MIENFVFGRSGLISSVFEKVFISYSYILFIKQCALRSFCIKMLCFPKIFFFQIFDRSTCCSTDRKCNKNFGYNLPGSIGARLVLDRSKLIFDQSTLIFDQSKIGQRDFFFFLKAFLTCSSHCSYFSKRFLSLLLRLIHSKSIFVVFFLIFLKVFVFKCR